MLVINLEVRLSNSMQGVMEFHEVSKDQALLDGVDLGLSAYYQMNPKAATAPYQILPSKEWNKLPKKLFMFREEPGVEMGLCKIVKKRISFPTAVAIPVYVIFEEGIVKTPTEINVMPTMADTFNS